MGAGLSRGGGGGSSQLMRREMMFSILLWLGLSLLDFVNLICFFSFLSMKIFSLPFGKKRRDPKRLPHNYQAIMKEADSPLDSSSDDLHDRLHSGVLLNQKKKKYWIDNNSGHNCFMLFAKDLSITQSEDPRYWRWFCMDETSGNAVKVAELLNVCWLEVYGKLKTSNLSPGITYEIAFVVMMKEQRYGWGVPVTLRLEGPNGQVQEHTECLKDKPRGQWIELHVGDFTSPGEEEGDLQFCLVEYKVGIWKRGLVIKGALVQPKK